MQSEVSQRKRSYESISMWQKEKKKKTKIVMNLQNRNRDRENQFMVTKRQVGEG